LEYLDGCGGKLDPTLATAAAYAIISETQDLEREARRADRETYQRLFPLVRLTILGRIRHPRRKREYYQTIARAMKKVLVSKHTCMCHIGEVPHAEIVAEAADFLAAMERVSWCLVTGFCPPNIVLSLRSRHVSGRAERVMRRMLNKLGHGGGHGMMANGFSHCSRRAS
jgi:nanoRNase/pAp phosphatase (c-di-AMP/oligoRNAs hydrolase)